LNIPRSAAAWKPAQIISSLPARVQVKFSRINQVESAFYTGLCCQSRVVLQG
jgi:hypothetical protein